MHPFLQVHVMAMNQLAFSGFHKHFGYFLTSYHPSEQGNVKRCCEDDFLTSYHPSEQDNVKLLRR